MYESVPLYLLKIAATYNIPSQLETLKLQKPPLREERAKFSFMEDESADLYSYVAKIAPGAKRFQGANTFLSGKHVSLNNAIFENSRRKYLICFPP